MDSEPVVRPCKPSAAAAPAPPHYSMLDGMNVDELLTMVSSDHIDPLFTFDDLEDEDIRLRSRAPTIKADDLEWIQAR